MSHCGRSAAQDRDGARSTLCSVDPFALVLGLILGGIALTLARAVVRVRREIDDLPPEEAEARARDRRHRAERQRCPRCRGPAVLLAGTGRGYRCEGCGLGFVGPEHRSAA